MHMIDGKYQAWRVYKNDKFTGITETNLAFASEFWTKQGRYTGHRYVLKQEVIQ